MYITDQTGQRKKVLSLSHHSEKPRAHFAMGTEPFMFMQNKSGDIITLVFSLLFLLIGGLLLWKFYKDRNIASRQPTSTSSFAFGFPV